MRCHRKLCELGRPLGCRPRSAGAWGIMAAAAVLVLAAGPAAAVDGTWNSITGGNWSDTTKWLDGIVAGGAGATLLISADNTAAATITLNTPVTIGNISGGDTGTGTDSGWIIGSNSLTLDDNPNDGVSVINTSGTNCTISSYVEVKGGLMNQGTQLVLNNNTASQGINFTNPNQALRTWTVNSDVAATNFVLKGNPLMTVNATWTLDNSNYPLGGLAGTGNIQNNTSSGGETAKGILVGGGNFDNPVFYGQLRGRNAAATPAGVKFTKTGAGRQTLAGESTSTSPFTVRSGELIAGTDSPSWAPVAGTSTTSTITIGSGTVTDGMKIQLVGTNSNQTGTPVGSSYTTYYAVQSTGSSFKLATTRRRHSDYPHRRRVSDGILGRTARRVWDRHRRHRPGRCQYGRGRQRQVVDRRGL